MKDIIEVKSVLAANKKMLFEKYSLKSMSIFGSFSRSKNHADSDVDVLVDFSEPIGIRFIDLADEMESLLKISVDLVSRNGIKEKYYQAIKSDLIHV